MDEKEGQNGFDGEDAWQTVSNWGTSNSTALAVDLQIDGYGDVGIEEDEAYDYVEPIENLLATDLYGKHVMVVRNETYRRYIERGRRSAAGRGLITKAVYWIDTQPHKNPGIKRLRDFCVVTLFFFNCTVHWR